MAYEITCDGIDAIEFRTLALLIAITVVGILCALARREWLAVLNEKTDVEFNTQPLSDVLIYLSFKHDYKCRVDDTALDATGIAADQIMITETVTDMPLGDALERLLTPHGLDFYVEAGHCVITTRYQARWWRRWHNRPTKDINAADWP